MHKCVNIDSLNDEFINRKDSLKNLNVKERSNGRIAKSHYGKNDAEHKMQNGEKNYLDDFDSANGNVNKNYIYSCDNLMDEDSSKNSNQHSKTVEENLKNYRYHVDPEHIRSNKYRGSEERVGGNHLISLAEQRNMILSKERINSSYFSRNYDNKSDDRRSDGHKSKDQGVNMMSNHYNNLIRTTNKGIENINSNCDAIISNKNYDSMSDVSSIILMNKNDSTQSNKDYADYNYNSYFNYRNDHTSAHHYNGSANNGGQNCGSRTRHYNGGSAENSKRHSNGYNNRNHGNGNYEGEKRECFPLAHESSLNENLAHESCDYTKVGKVDLEMPDNELNSLPVYNGEDTQNRIFQEMDEPTKQGDMHITSRLKSTVRENTNNRIKIYDIFNNPNIKKGNNTNTGILNFLKNKRTNKYTYDSKGVRNDAAESKDMSKESHSSGVSNKSGGIPADGHRANGHTANGHNAGGANTSGHSNTEGSHSNYRFNANMRNAESSDPCNNSPVIKGCTYNEEEAKNKLATSNHILINQKYIEEKEGKPSKEELSNKCNINSFETLKHLEKDDNGDATNSYGTAVNEFLNKKDSRSDEYSNKIDAAKKEQNNPFSVYHYVKKERSENAAPLSNDHAKRGSNKSSNTGSKGNEKYNINVKGGSSKNNQKRNNIERNHNPIHSECVDNHECSNELPPRDDKANKKSTTPRDAATNSNDNHSIGKKGLHVYKTGSELQNGNLNHYSKKGIKKDSFDREHRMDMQRGKPDKDHHHLKEELQTNGEFPSNAKWNENSTYYLQEENRKNEKIKMKEELSSKYVSSYSESTLPSSTQSFAESKNRVHQNSRNSKNALTKEIKKRSDIKYNAKRKMDMKEKQENEQFHRSRSNSLNDDISCISEDAKQNNFVDGIGGNRTSRKDTCRYIVNNPPNSNNAKKNNKGVATDVRIPGQPHNYDEANAPLQQNNYKNECRNAPTVYVKKKKKKKKKKHNGSDQYTESCSDRGGASSRDEDGGNNGCKASLNGEDSSVISTNRRSSSPNVNHSDPRNGVKRGSKKYPGERNSAFKELSVEKEDEHYGDGERGNGRDDAYVHLVARKLAHSMNPFRHNVTTNRREGDRGSNECDSGAKEWHDYNNRDRCGRHSKCNRRGADKNGNVNTLEKLQIAQECKEKCVTKKKEKKKKKEEPLRSKQKMAQDEDIAHGDDTDVFVKCKMKKKSSYIISDDEQHADSIRGNVPSSKTHFVASGKKMHQRKENSSKKSTLRKGANESSSSFNSSSNENYEKDEVKCDKKAVRRKSALSKESNIKKMHRTPLHSNTSSIRNSKGTNTGNSYNSQSRRSNLRNGMNDISSSSEDLDDGEIQNAKTKKGKNRNSHFPNSGKIELKFCSGEGENQRYRHERETSDNGTENRDSNSDSDADSHVGKQNRAVNNVTRDSYIPNCVNKKKKRQSNLVKSKNDTQQDLSTGEDNSDCDNLKEKGKRKKKYPSRGCSNNPTNGSSKLVYNRTDDQSALHDRHRSVKRGGTPNEDEQIYTNVQHESEQFSNNANGVTIKGGNMCKGNSNIDGANINDPRMSYADISTPNHRTHSSKNSMGTFDNPARVGSLSKRRNIQLMTPSEENFNYSPQEKYPNMRCAPMGCGNTNHMDAHLKYTHSGNNEKGNAEGMVNGNEFAHQRVDWQNGEYKNLVMTEDVVSGERVSPMEEQRMGRQLQRESTKQNTSLFYQKDGNLDDIFTHNNKGELLCNSKHMLNRNFLNVDPTSGYNPHKVHNIKETITEDNPFKKTEYLHNIKKTESNHNRSSNMPNEDNTYNSIYEKEDDIFLKNNVCNQWNRKPDTLLTAHRRKNNDEGVNVNLSTNRSVNINYNHEDTNAYQSKNAYMGEEQIFPGENCNNIFCKNRYISNDRNDEILHQKGKSHLFSSRGQEVENIYKRDSFSNVPVMRRGAPAHVAKSVQSTYQAYVNNATQEKPQPMGDPCAMIYHPMETHTSANCYTPHPNFLQKEAKVAQRSIQNNPFALHSRMKSASMDGGINYYKMEQKNVMNFTPPTDRGSQKEKYDACRVRLFDKTRHGNVNGEQSDWFACKADFEKNACERKRTNNMEGGVGTKGFYGPGDPNDERSQRYMHMGGVAPFSGIYPSSSDRYRNGVNGVNAQNGDDLHLPHGEDTTIHGIRKNNDGNNNANMNGIPFDKGINIHVSSALNEADKKGMHMNSQVVYSELESAAILNEVLRKNNENWNKPYGAANRIQTLRFTNNFPVDFANILKNYKDKTDNYLNKQYIQDLERIHFLIQDFTNSYRCSDNLKSIFQLLQYEIEKEKRENLYFCQDQKYVVLTMPLNDMGKNYDNWGEPNIKEPICAYKLDTCFLENLEKQSKGESSNWGRNHLREDLTKAYNIVRNSSRGDDPNYDGSDYDANDKCEEKCTTENCRGLCMRAPSCTSSQNSTTDVGTSAESVVLHTDMQNGEENTHVNGSDKQVRTNRCIGNLPKTDKLGKHCISKKRCSDSLNESILSKMNIFLIRHNNRVYKFKLNSNFPLRGNQLNSKKNGKLFKLLSSFYKELFKEKCSKRNVLLNGDVSLSYVNNVDPTKDNLSNDQTDNGIAKSTYINNEDNFYNIIQSSGLTNIDDLFISDDEVNLIYMYSNHRNEKVYSLEKLDVLKNENSTLSTLSDCADTGEENYSCKK
ncbi:Uncharacterized protein PCOAH_00046940 [Plasmodium coatneyi]|uniref:Uncharacterized protein n=1 Tax=Plasmodium coatneyi TaxID=208452 RepID=A0A1B1E5V9_9APIC|nr:Uncharacterized protein PCOAH_00046940 [Plasmodium coatneyi]ANQ10373.1 Uncharacterized protein PCOAH_00046940 [Plasmodium coatneyi]